MVSKVFTEWCINPRGPNNVCIVGYAVSEESAEQKFFVTDEVRSRAGPHHLTCVNGEVIELRGGVAFTVGENAGIPTPILNLFKNGFPRYWRKAIENWNYGADTSTESKNPAKIHKCFLERARLFAAGEQQWPELSKEPAVGNGHRHSHQQQAARGSAERPVNPTRYELRCRSVPQAVPTQSSQTGPEKATQSTKRSPVKNSKAHGNAETPSQQRAETKESHTTNRRSSRPRVTRNVANRLSKKSAKESAAIVRKSTVDERATSDLATKNRSKGLNGIKTASPPSTVSSQEAQKRAVVLLTLDDRSACTKALTLVTETPFQHEHFTRATPKKDMQCITETQKQNAEEPVLASRNSRHNQVTLRMTRSRSRAIGSRKDEAAHTENKDAVASQDKHALALPGPSTKSGQCGRKINTNSSARKRRKVPPRTRMTEEDSPSDDDITCKDSHDITLVSENKIQPAEHAPRRATRSCATKGQSREAADKKVTAVPKTSETNRVRGRRGKNTKVEKGNREVATSKQSPKSKAVRSALRKKQDDEVPVQLCAITAGKGTLKRKRQVRAAAKAVADATMDDCFPVGDILEKLQRPLPGDLVLPRTDSDNESELSGMRTPSECSLQQSLPQSPQSTSSVSSTDILKADRYIYQMEKEGRKRTESPFTSTPVVRKKRSTPEAFFNELRRAEQRMHLIEEKENYERSDPVMDWFTDGSETD
uniref:SANTA domain-containing protein n=1 Tax=Ornithodoros erraticus TaxID=265619 RepID=A0A293LLU1_ORNER